MQPQISNPSTTIRRYSLVAEASQREQDALQEWIQAGAQNEKERSTESGAALTQAAAKLKQAIEDRHSVVRKTFPMPVHLTAHDRGNGITDFTFGRKE
jgi:hypothetical protein